MNGSRPIVMAGLVPAIHVLGVAACEDVDARDERRRGTRPRAVGIGYKF
jgi:hypothetical protein